MLPNSKNDTPVTILVKRCYPITKKCYPITLLVTDSIFLKIPQNLRKKRCCPSEKVFLFLNSIRFTRATALSFGRKAYAHLGCCWQPAYGQCGQWSRLHNISCIDLLAICWGVWLLISQANYFHQWGNFAFKKPSNGHKQWVSPPLIEVNRASRD